MSAGEAYLDIVWKQFRRNRTAYAMLWVAASLFLAAIFAPLAASNQPFWFDQDGARLYPWLLSLAATDTVVDTVFNAALVVFLPWAAAAALWNRRSRRRGMPGRVRVVHVSLLFAVLVAAATLAMIVFRPDNKYFASDFKRDQMQGRGQGVYPPIAWGPTEQDLDSIYKPPLHRNTAPVRFRGDEPHFMGTDDSGRDVLVRLLYGSRISLTVGFVAISIYLTLGIIIGALAGYFGGAVDITISRAIEVVLLFPTFFLILTLVALLDKYQGIYIIMAVIGLTGWPTIARLIRGEFLRQRSQDYVAAARALGASHARVMFRHILPNAMAPALVAAPFGIAGAIVTEAGLSVLGLGVRAPTPSWGAILNLAVKNHSLWWLVVSAGTAIFITVTVFNLVGNGLRDAMDPKLKGVG